MKPFRIRFSATRRGLFLSIRFRSNAGTSSGLETNPPGSDRPPAPARQMHDAVPPLRPGTYSKGGRNTEPLPPRPDRSPRPTGVPGWVVQPPASNPPRP